MRSEEYRLGEHMGAPDLSIVTVNYNCTELLKACLASICRNLSDIRSEIFVVDNHSTDADVSSIARLFPQIRLIVNECNYGFARANNQAIKQARGRYILLLNPDSEVGDNALSKLVKFMEQNPDVGVSGGKIIKPDGELELAARRNIPTPRMALFKLLGLSRMFPRSPLTAAYNLTHIDPDKQLEVGAVSGSFMMIRREVFDAVGLLDESFFLYGEDLDFCLRAKRAGWKVVYYPQAEILHYKGQSSKTRRLRSVYQFYRAMYVFYRKHYAPNSFALMNALIYSGIGLLGAIAVAKEAFLMMAKNTTKVTLQVLRL